MFEKMVSIFVAFLSLFGVFYSGKNMDVYSDVAYVATSNYVDVYFDYVEMEKGQFAILEDRLSIQMESISESDIITYELFNNSYSYDVEVRAFINGESVYEDEYVRIECMSVEILPSGEVIRGMITVEVLQEGYEINNIPTITFQVVPIQKEYLQ